MDKEVKVIICEDDNEFLQYIKDNNINLKAIMETLKENKMTKEQQEILEQDRKETQEYIDSLSQEELDYIPVEEDLISDEELQEMQDSLDILLEQYTSNLEEIEKYKDVLREYIISDITSQPVDITLNNTFKAIKLLFKQLNKENKILLEEIKSLEFDINYYTNN